MPVKSGLPSAVRGIAVLWAWPDAGMKVPRSTAATAAPAARMASRIRVPMSPPPIALTEHLCRGAKKYPFTWSLSRHASTPGRVVQVSRRGEGPRNLQQIRSFRQRRRADADSFPVLLRFRHLLHSTVLVVDDTDRVEDVVGDRVEHVPHQFLDGNNGSHVSPELG